MSLSTLIRELVMCIIMIACKQPNALVEMGINNSAQVAKKEGDDIF